MLSVNVPATPGNSFYRVTLSGLQPAKDYLVTVTSRTGETVSENLTSTFTLRMSKVSLLKII